LCHKTECAEQGPWEAVKIRVTIVWIYSTFKADVTGLTLAAKANKFIQMRKSNNLKQTMQHIIFLYVQV